MFDDVDHGLTLIGTRCYVKKRDLVGAFFVVTAGDLDRIAGITNINKFDAFDNTSIVNIEAGNDSFGQGHSERASRRYHIRCCALPASAAPLRGRSCPRKLRAP